MKFDLSLSPFGITVNELVDAARLAEAEGFDAVWVYDHVSGVAMGANEVLDPWVCLSALAGATSAITLGPLVLNSIIRHPAHIAVAAATLQQLSGGRLMLGMGAGAGTDSYGVELGMVGLPRRSSVERREIIGEAIGMVRALWRGDTSFEGRHHRMVDASGFVKPYPHPAIIVGANGPKMAALAGRVADAVNFHWYEPELESLVDIARRAAADRPFQTTVEAILEDHWLIGRGLGRLRSVGVDRVTYRWNHADGLGAISTAAAKIGASRRDLVPRSGLDR